MNLQCKLAMVFIRIVDKIARLGFTGGQFVVPAGIEPASSESESEILSIVLRNQEVIKFYILTFEI